jgi:hypothetical protein
MLKKITTGLTLLVCSLVFQTNLVMAARAPILPTATIDHLFPPPAPATVDGKTTSQEQYFGGVFLPTITKTVISLSGSLAILFIIYGGIMILTAYGNDEKVKKGRTTVQYAIVGLLISILAYAIVTIVSSINIG